MSLASHPDERADAIEIHLRQPGAGTLARAFTPRGAPDAGTALQRATAVALRGGLTTWVHVGMLVRRMRGRADPLEGLDREATFQALCRLAQAAVEGIPLAVRPGADEAAHVALFTTPYPAEPALARLNQVLQPYAAASTLTRSGHAVIGWFAIRHLIGQRSDSYSLQVVHLTADPAAANQVSLMLPRAAQPGEGGVADGLRRLGPRRLRRAQEAQRAQDARRAQEAQRVPPAAATRAGATPRGSAPPEGRLPLQAYLDAYREHLTRELLLEPVVATGSAGEFLWTPESTGDGGVAVGGTVPHAVPDHVVLRMAAHAVSRLGEQSPDAAGVVLGDPEPDGDLLVQRWAVGADRAYVLSVAARSGDRRRPTQVLIHFAAQARPTGPAPTAGTSGAPREELPVSGYEVPRTGADVDEARGLLILPLWWHSAEARCDGNDVILYEMPFRGHRLRVRANDYPAEPMYTLLVGDPGAETAAVDVESWPSAWVRPRAY